MFGIPYYDKDGLFGVSNRDNFIILQEKYSDYDMIQLCKYLSMKWVQCIYNSTRYRMKCLEKHAFAYIPNFLNMKGIDFPDDNILFSKKEREYIDFYTRSFQYLKDKD